MKLELDHVFILVEPEAKVADLLVELGFQEGRRNKHEGQGTSNRRFFFSNGMLELLWLHDAEEAKNGPGRDLFFPERENDSGASPFGVILRRINKADFEMPFDGWKYQPDYFSPPWAFHVGSNSKYLVEPLCIYVPFIEPAASARKKEEGTFKSIDNVLIHTPSDPFSNILDIVDSADRLSIVQGDKHLMEITFDDRQCGKTRDFRPDIPLVINW
ncbi:MAG: VOC family protein [Gammaproteobacteria bacterium]|nr:VOC family protein [Gammaproteobacteria bacterium]